MAQLTAFPQNMLIIDDDPGLLRALELLITTLGHKTKTFANSTEALEFIRNPDMSSFSMVLSDLRMPDHDGFSVLEQRNQHIPHIPFVLMSGHATQKDVDAALQNGANGFLGKPFRPEALEELLTSLFGH